MRQIIRDFLDSDKTESDFFDLQKENLISLREYLLELQAKDKEFMDLVDEPVSSMKEKCQWIKDIAFNLFQKVSDGEIFSSTVWLFPDKGSNLIVKSDRKTGEYKELAERIPKIYLISGRIREHIRRQGELKHIQEELHEIDQTGRTFYDGLLYPKKSISGHFDVHYFPNVGTNLFNDGDSIANYYVRPMKIYEKPYLNDENKSKVLTRIQLQKEKTREF